MQTGVKSPRLWYIVTFFFLKILFIDFFRERGRKIEREGEKQQCVVARHAPPTRDMA